MSKARNSSHAMFAQEIKKAGEAYPSIGPRMPKEVDLKQYEAVESAYDKSMEQVRSLEAALKKAQKLRTDRRKAGGQFLKRLRRAVSAIFGEDSIEYATVGGTRTSERKTPVRKPKAKLAPDTPKVAKEPTPANDNREPGGEQEGEKKVA